MNIVAFVFHAPGDIFDICTFKWSVFCGLQVCATLLQLKARNIAIYYSKSHDGSLA